VLKRRLAQSGDFDAASLPHNTALLEWLRLQRSHGRKLILCTASDLYTLCIIAGAAALSMPTPFWLLAFPVFLFLSLPFVKRYVDKNPPVTTQQLAALSAKDAFEVIDWLGKFGVLCTPFSKAIDETFNDPKYSKVILEF
jgi:hypothetical protein